MIPIRDTTPRRRFPWVNLTLIALNTAVFLYELQLGTELDGMIRAFGVIPARFHWMGDQGGVAWVTRFLPVFTGTFLHAGWLHLLGNMLFLYIFGDNVEDRLGHTRYAVFYLLAGAAAAYGQALAVPQSAVPMIGASGAIAAVLGAYFFFFPRARVVTVVVVLFFIRIVRLPAAWFAILWFLMQLAYGMADMQVAGHAVTGVAWWAHIAGFLFGVSVGPLFALRRRKRRWRYP